MSPRRPTQQDVAKAAGVHRATVSLVLRNHPSIPEATRQKVHQAAREIGYVPDPMLAALAAYRSRTTPRAFQGMLAWVNFTSRHPENEAEHACLFEGAARRAEELGYRMEELTQGIHFHQGRDLRRILLARGIRGVLFYGNPGNSFDFNFSGLSVMTVGPAPVLSHLHTVTNSPSAMIDAALEQLRNRGFHRIGILLPPQNSGSPPMMRALAEPLSSTGETAVSVLGCRQSLREEWHTWYVKHRPEAMIAADLEQARQLEANGLLIPKVSSVAVIGMASGTPFWGGMNANFEEMGRVAISSVVHMIHSNEVGVPAIRRSILVEGRWEDGQSVECRNELPAGPF